jgi:hypothetical protein
MRQDVTPLLLHPHIHDIQYQWSSERVKRVEKRMPDLWTLSARDIEWYAQSDTILERGRSYYRSGRVRELHLVSEDRLRARVRGQWERFYRVDVWIEDGEVYSSCTCPYSWGVCKHVVAVLLAWLDRRETLSPRTSTSTETRSLATWLETVPPDVLRDMLQEESRTNSAIEDALRRWRDLLRPERIPTRIIRLFQGLQMASPAGIRRHEEWIVHLLAWAKAFDPGAAAAIARQTLTCAVEMRRARPDVELTAIIAQVLELIEHHADAFAGDRPFTTSVLRNMVELFLLGRATVRALLEPSLLTLSERWSRRADVIAELKKRLLGPDSGAYALLATLCRLEGAIEEYEAAREHSLVSEEDYLELFEHYLATNYPDRAMRVGERGIKALGAKAPRLRERLAALYREWGETARAKRILKRT